ncbi:aldehyde dehydrogenase family protein [Leptospira sp. GIMC2001]|uniref:aldehyde dehydrogenase family protein n=1 Tax=Leptospira sp. GIMC2001 TaxID=1513297 RepID=UPI00234BB4A8|nr:aldehyde dehydrogenase family protein [Leptospira sp. GIMC2001]WCL49467.1 aldehyde dehydrogenase family protein [Leptospira sp. GIMC2001]
MIQYRNFIDGQWIESKEVHVIKNPWNDEVVSQCAIANEKDIELCLEASKNARVPFSHTSRFLRSKLLSRMVELIQDHKDSIVESIILEAGKPITLADGEFARCINTFKTAIDESTRFTGEIYPMDIDSGGRAFETAKTEFFPKGVILAITPFNFPLNLVAHKIAPAFAVGAPVILKPAPQAPGASFILADIFQKALQSVNNEFGTKEEQIPEAAFQVLFCNNELAEKMVKDSRISIISFTGSASVGWKIQELGIKKKVLLELGGNAGVIVCEDSDWKFAAERIAFGSVSYAGQSCISVQRIYVDAKIYDNFRTQLLLEFKKVKTGDPTKKEILVGPLIDRKASERIVSWIQEAKSLGCNVLLGGTLDDKVLPPTLLENVALDAKISQEEVFGPVAILEKIENLEEGIAKLNNSKYGLHAGIFTNNLNKMNHAFKDLEVGGLIVNEVPTFRADHMPYGGVKESGLGREGVRYAMEDFCERKTLVVKKA